VCCPWLHLRGADVNIFSGRGGAGYIGRVPGKYLLFIVVPPAMDILCSCRAGHGRWCSCRAGFGGS
jgi:hypothetical protein